MTKKRRQTKDRDQSEDQSLWHRVMETVTPLSPAGRRNDRVRDFQDQAEAVSPDVRPTSKDADHHAKSKRSPGQADGAEISRPSRPSSDAERTPPVPKPGAVSHADGRKLRSGRIAIDARLDLHGMRQSEAHAALKRFLYSCHHKGFRWVLVITGKGIRRAATARDDATGFETDGASAPGVLRRMVPVWLNQPDLRSMVIGFETAGPQHGGEGALYVNIRRVKPHR